MRAARKSRRHRGGEFLAFEFLFLSRPEVGGRLEYRPAGEKRVKYGAIFASTGWIFKRTGGRVLPIINGSRGPEETRDSATGR